ncbi:hypothetical protein TELCIR_04103 [Teladorsagia circumcincta]|uniref:Uncharacterized protein n=1 Tax=Teladorsagia circumcincta TaxID=45464 RepID=A0A2G9UWN4_TELCI|nr:hypothetical protein TELCIR_04103 [Teladorsagia circumcincta]
MRHLSYSEAPYFRTPTLCLPRSTHLHGQQLARRNREEKKCAWSAMGTIKEVAQIMSGKKIGADLFNSTVLPAPCDASETWAENNTFTMMMARAQRALERTLLNINSREHISRNLRSTDMRLMSGIRDAVVYTGDTKKRFAGHAVRRRTTGGPLASRRGIHETLSAHLAVLHRYGETPWRKAQEATGQHWVQIAQDQQHRLNGDHGATEAVIFTPVNHRRLRQRATPTYAVKTTFNSISHDN